MTNTELIRQEIQRCCEEINSIAGDHYNEYQCGQMHTYGSLRAFIDKLPKETLQDREYTIPEGMLAVIENGKVIIREKVSEEERMWDKILNHFDWSFKGPYLTHEECDEIKAFLVKQKEQNAIPSRPSWKSSEEQKYDGNMDKECIKLCDVLNSNQSIDTFESCCGHLKDRYSIWFFCTDIITLSRLGRCVSHNYSDGKWELLVDSTDTHPTGVFWLRSKVPFQSYNEMEKSVNELCNNIQHWFNPTFDSYFKKDLEEVKQEEHWKPSEEQMKALEAAFRKDGNDEYRRTINSLYTDLQKLL